MSPIPAGERGATRVADRVVAKIAAQAAREALRTVPDGTAVPGGTADPDGTAGADGTAGPGAFTRRPGVPHATVNVRVPSGTGKPGRGGPPDRTEARVRVAVELRYPCDIAARCAVVRSRVVRRVDELADMAVPEVVVEVERLYSAHFEPAGPGRVQ